MLEADSVLGPQHVPVEDGVPQRQVADLDLPALVVEPDQFAGRVLLVVEQIRDQPVPVADPAAVGTGDGELRVVDPHPQSVQVGQVGTVGQMGQHRWSTGGFAAYQEPRAGGVDLGEERGGVESPVKQDHHARRE